VLGLNALKLDGNLFTGDNVGTEVDVTETATTDLTTDAVFVAYAKILQREVSMLLSSKGSCRWWCGG
jgi:hypothetical protein